MNRPRLFPAALILLLSLSFLFLSWPAAAQEGYVITSFHASYVINQDASVDVVEDVEVDFGDHPRHGIIRAIPVEYQIEGDPRHHRLITLENIQRTVSEYFNIRVTDLGSKSRRRSLARPRQIAMALARELTQHSLPEIGESFGGRDHTTVLHACKQIKDLRERDPKIKEDYDNLMRQLSY